MKALLCTLWMVLPLTACERTATQPQLPPPAGSLSVRVQGNQLVDQADPLNNVAASWHIYNFSWCNTQACWDSNAAPVAQQVPIVLGELGQDDYGSAFVTSLMDWMDARQGSYLAWSWDVWGQSLDLIQSYDGTPTPYGRTFQIRFGS